MENDGAYLEARRAWRTIATLPPGDVGGMAMFVRCDLFDEIGFIDEGYFVYGEENDFQLRAEKSGYRTVSINIPVWHYGQGFFGSVPTRAAMLQTRSKIRLLIKHGSPWTLLRGGVRHFFRRILRPAAPPASVVEKRLKPSKNPFMNLGLLAYCVAWNLWFLPRTLTRRWEDNRRALAVRKRWS
jgi:GT2 family glycosyltransferase